MAYRRSFKMIVWLIILILSECALLRPSFADVTGSDGQEMKDSFSGNMAVRYRLTYDSERASAIHQFVQRADLAWRPFAGDSGFVFSGDLYENTGGTDERPESVWAAYGDVHGFINESYAEVRDMIPALDVRAGRQYVTDELSVHLDGIQARYRFSGRAAVYLLGGYAADPYGDEAWDYSKVAGAGFKYLITERTRAGAEYLMTREEPEDVERETFQQAALSLTHNFDTSRVGIKLTSLDSELESMKLNASFLEILGEDSEAGLSYFNQFVEAERMPSSSSPFISLLGPVKPYYQASVNVCKGFALSKIMLSGGFDLRKLLEDESESEFNHSYIHGYTALDKTDLWGKDLRFSVQADMWRNSDAGSDSKTTVTGGGEIEYGKSGKTSYALGSFYSRYSYDYYMDTNEKTDVYTVFSRIRHRIGKSVQIKGEYELDITDQEEHRLDVTANVDF